VQPTFDVANRGGHRLKNRIVRTDNQKLKILAKLRTANKVI
jgi:hypothetical protein